jgi:hypothetical protein
MSQRRSALARLQEELRNIEVFDRIHEYAPHADPVQERAYSGRQIRRKQILDDIARLRGSESEPAKHAWISSAVVFVCAVGYAMLRYLLK